MPRGKPFFSKPGVPLGLGYLSGKWSPSRGLCYLLCPGLLDTPFMTRTYSRGFLVQNIGMKTIIQGQTNLRHVLICPGLADRPSRLRPRQYARHRLALVMVRPDRQICSA